MIRVVAAVCAWMAAVTTVVSFTAFAADRTQIDGAFDGCDHDKVYPLVDGRLLVCHEYNYDYSYSPEVIVVDDSRVLIDDELFEAGVEFGQIVRTRVAADFEGCDFSKLIPFDNGLIFECATYHYHYAYRPEVLIVVRQSGYQVYIDGDRYAGTLFKR
jgi:hypothetical protein